MVFAGFSKSFWRVSEGFSEVPASFLGFLQGFRRLFKGFLSVLGFPQGVLRVSAGLLNICMRVFLVFKLVSGWFPQSFAGFSTLRKVFQGFNKFPWVSCRFVWEVCRFFFGNSETSSQQKLEKSYNGHYAGLRQILYLCREHFCTFGFTVGFALIGLNWMRLSNVSAITCTPCIIWITVGASKVGEIFADGLVGCSSSGL